MSIDNKDIVPTNVEYSSALFFCIVHKLVEKYPFIEQFKIGESVCGKEITALRIGTGKTEAFYSASFHANEWITTPVLLKFLEEYADSFVAGIDFCGYNPAWLFQKYTLYLVPMVNPDGVDIVSGNAGQENYNGCASEWKANARGVDLNLQFPAGWDNARRNKALKGVVSPGARDFPGYYPLSEPESRAVYEFTLKHDFKLILAYHSQGEVIYWKYQDYNPKYSMEIAEYFQKASGYEMEEVPDISGYAGFKDWFIMHYNRPGFTIEVGCGENPLPISQFDKIYHDNTGILIGGLVKVVS